MKFAIAAMAAFAALPAHADEIWTSKAGEIIYETVVGPGMAVLSAPAQMMVADAPADARVWIYVPDLANSDGVRGFHEGYWIVEGMDYCPVALTAPDGRTSTSWGRVQIAFDEPDFPTGFTMITGFCAWDPFLPVRAEAYLG